MKKVLILIGLCLLAMVVANRNKHRLRNRKMDLSFSTESMSEQNEKPKYLEHIYKAKSTGISAKFSTVGEENKEEKTKDLTQEQRFKESNNNVNNINMNNLESPTIVPNLGTQQPFNVDERVASRQSQNISNRQAFDLKYGSHTDYYKDKRFIVFDRNYDKVNDYLVKQFKSAIDQAIDYSDTKNLVHVEDFDKNKVNLRGLDLQNGAPFVHPAVVGSQIRYDPIKQNDPNVKITSSDPYATIFGGYMK